MSQPQPVRTPTSCSQHVRFVYGCAACMAANRR